MDMEAERTRKAEGEVAGQNPWIVVDDILPLAGASLPDPSDYLSMRASVHVGANGLMADHVVHGRVPMPPPSPTKEHDLALIGRVARRVEVDRHVIAHGRVGEVRRAVADVVAKAPGAAARWRRRPRWWRHDKFSKECPIS